MRRSTVCAVARSYIDPRVIRHYENGRAVAVVLGDLGRDSSFGDLATSGRAESAVLKLLTVRRSHAPVREKDLDLSERARGPAKPHSERPPRRRGSAPQAVGDHSPGGGWRVRFAYRVCPPLRARLRRASRAAPCLARIAIVA